MSTETGLNVTAPIATSRAPIERNDQVSATATDRSSRCFRQSPISRTGRAPNQVLGWRGWRKATANSGGELSSRAIAPHRVSRGSLAKLAFESESIDPKAPARSLISTRRSAGVVSSS